MGHGAAAAVAVETQKPAAAKPLGRRHVEQIQCADVAAWRILAEHFIRQRSHLRERVAAIHKQPGAQIGFQRAKPVSRPPEITAALRQHRLADDDGLQTGLRRPTLHLGAFPRLVVGREEPVGVRKGYSGRKHKS